MTLLEFVILFGFALVILGVVLAAIRLVRGQAWRTGSWRWT